MKAIYLGFAVAFPIGFLIYWHFFFLGGTVNGVLIKDIWQAIPTEMHTRWGRMQIESEFFENIVILCLYTLTVMGLTKIAPRVSRAIVKWACLFIEWSQD